MSNAERLEELIKQAEQAHGLAVSRVQPTMTLLRAIDSEIVEPLEKRITELERQLEQRANLCADIPEIKHTDKLPQYDPVYVRTLWQAYSEVKAAQRLVHIDADEDIDCKGDAPEFDEDWHLMTMYSGTAFLLNGMDYTHMVCLPKGYYIAKNPTEVQP